MKNNGCLFGLVNGKERVVSSKLVALFKLYKEYRLLICYGTHAIMDYEALIQVYFSCI
jgi:hypothetical protein